MAHRHQAQAKKHGGKVFYAGSDSHVAAEATDPHSHKRGGKAHHKKDGGKVAGFKTGGRLDKRARGGGIGKGADKSPYSSAHIASAHGHQHKSGGRVGK
jgi:hypothetical protein